MYPGTYFILAKIASLNTVDKLERRYLERDAVTGNFYGFRYNQSVVRLDLENVCQHRGEILSLKYVSCPL